MTGNAATEEGGVAYGLSVPTTDPLDVTFDSSQYEGSTSRADGIGFFLAAANPADPSPPAALAQPGGSLGYSAVGTEDPGITYGYLGVGLDVFGNYANTTFEGTGCTDPGWDSSTAFPDNVSVRGPGNGTSGYCLLNSTAASGGLSSGTLDGGASGTRSSATVPVEVVINPGGSSVTTASGLDVAADSYEVAFTPIGGTQQTLGGTLPTVSGLGFPSSWLNPNGIPYQLAFGWVGSTGSDYEIHEIKDASLSTVGGTPPTLSVSATDNAGGAPAFGSTMENQVTVADQGGASNDPGPIDVTDTLPAGETAQTSGLGGTGWSCSISGQSVSCHNSGSLNAGASLPTLVIPASVTAHAGTTLTNTALSSSDSSDPASTEHAVTVSKAATSLTASAIPTSTAYGNTVQLSASGLPGGATGMVTFVSGGSTLCSASVSSGSGSCSTAVLAPATYSVSVTYSGDSDYSGSTASTSFTISKAATSLTASAIPTSTAYGNTVQLSASGLPGGATGTITFASGGSTLCSTTASPGSGSCSTAVLAPGTYSVNVTYSGDSDYDASTASTSFTIVVPPSASITTPADGAIYAQNEPVDANYTCADDPNGPGIASCTGPASDGAPIETSTTGSKTFEVTATSSDGLTSTASVTYTVAAAPQALISSPVSNAQYALGQKVLASLSCKEGASGPGIASCTGTVADGNPIDTSSTGSHSFKVTATSADGQSTAETITYAVIQPPPTVATSGSPSTRIQGTTVFVSPGIMLSCPSGGAACSSDDTAVATVAPAARAKTKRVLIGSARFTTPAGKQRELSLALNRQGMRLLAELGRLRVTVTVLSRAGSSKTLTTTKTITIKEPARKQRRR